MKLRPAVGAFVRNKEGKYLLVETRAKVGNVVEKYWDIPKGGLEKGETFKQALKRELKEELNIDKLGEVKKLNLSFCFKFPVEIKRRVGYDGEKVELFFVQFLGKKSDIRIDNEETIKFIFVNEKEFLKRVSFETTKQAFKKFLKKFR